MDYVRKYKEALERARQFIEHPLQEDSANIVEYIFPELKESEDEKIRKTLIEYIKGIKSWNYFLGISKEQMIAWLEKQCDYNRLVEEMKKRKELLSKEKEKATSANDKLSLGGRIAMLQELLAFNICNTTDKITPKFKVGDWITNGDYTWEVTDIAELDYVLRSQDGNIVDDTISYVDEHFHLWSIQDEKAGDVFVSGEVIFIFNKIHGVWVNCYCSLHKDGSFCEENYDLMHIKYAETIYPSTKEQRDTFFAKMKEAGYEWDSEKKELKKIKIKSENLESKSLDADKVIG